MNCHTVMKSNDHIVSLIEGSEERFFLLFNNCSEGKDIFFTGNQKNFNKLKFSIETNLKICDIESRNEFLKNLWKKYKKYAINSKDLMFYKIRFSII